MTLARDSKPPRELAAAVFDAIFEEAPKPACPTCNGTGWVYACKSVADGSNLLEPCPACLNRHTASPDARMVAAGAIRPEAVEREEQAAQLYKAYMAVGHLIWARFQVLSEGEIISWLAVRDKAAAMFQPPAAPPATLTSDDLRQVREALAEIENATEPASFGGYLHVPMPAARVKRVSAALDLLIRALEPKP